MRSHPPAGRRQPGHLLPPDHTRVQLELLHGDIQQSTARAIIVFVVRRGRSAALVVGNGGRHQQEQAAAHRHQEQQQQPSAALLPLGLPEPLPQRQVSAPPCAHQQRDQQQQPLSPLPSVRSPLEQQHEPSRGRRHARLGRAPSHESEPRLRGAQALHRLHVHVAAEGAQPPLAARLHARLSSLVRRDRASVRPVSGAAPQRRQLSEHTQLCARRATHRGQLAVHTARDRVHIEQRAHYAQGKRCHRLDYSFD